MDTAEQVSEGMDVLEKVNEAFVDAQGRPLQVHCSSCAAPLAVRLRPSGAKQLPFRSAAHHHAWTTIWRYF